jgi:enoyl-CoA hydratase/carnithine racemase
MTAGGVRVDVDGPLATVTLSRPEVSNAQTPRMWAELSAFGSAIPDTVRAVIVRAEGKTFSAGLDRAMFGPEGVDGQMSLHELARLDDEALAERLATFQSAFTWQRRADLISVAAVQGHAVGAGLQLALACDLRVVADDARFSMRETSLGLVPDLGGTARLVEAVGYSRALELCVTGRTVDAREAYRWGLATLVVPRADLDDATHDLIAAVTAAPYAAVTETKALLVNAARRGHEEQLAAERSAQVRRLRDLTRVAGGNPLGDGGVAGGDE